MKILHITSVTNPKGNGVAVAVENYFKYENKIIDVGIYNLESNVVNDDNSFNYYEYKNIVSLPNGFDKPDLVIFNEIYKLKYIKLYKECIKNNIKYIIIPHGCLVKESQNKHRIKKVMANFLLFNSFIKNSYAIQFLNEIEKENSIFNNLKCIISGNGVSKPVYINEFKNDTKNIVYIGRYEVNHKGLDLIVDICARYKSWFDNNNIKIMLYGRDSGNELKELKKLIIGKKIGDTLVINGPIFDNEKEEVLKNAYAFIQCSRFEGQPMGIIEALSVGVPCIVTYGTNVGEFINKNMCGLVSNFDVDSVFDNIKKIIDDEKNRKKMSRNAIACVKRDFYWDVVIDNCVNQYRELLSK